MAAWLVLINDLVAFLDAAMPAVNWAPGYGLEEVIIPDPLPAGRIYRRQETDLSDIWARGHGKLNLAIDLWAENADPDPAAANTLLASMEDALIEGLKAWCSRAEAALKMRLSLSIDEITGDGDNYRPTVAAFYRITITWTK